MDSRTVYVDAAPNFWEQIIEDKEHPYYSSGKRYFKKIKGTDGHRYAITDEKGKLLETGVNRQMTWQVEAEAYGVLKAVEWAIKNKLTEIKILTDCRFIMGGATTGTSKAKVYMSLADNKARENNLDYKLEWVAGKKNLADRESRVIIVKRSDAPGYITWNNSLKSKHKYIYE